MTTRAEFLSGVRLELQDPGPANYVWPDALLQAFLKDSLNVLSLDLPPIKEITLAAAAGQRDYPLSPGTLVLGAGGIVEVQFPAGVVVPRGDTGPQYAGAAYLVSSNFQAFDQCWDLPAGAGDSSVLRFRYGPAQAGSILVRAFSVYTLPSSDAAALDVNGPDETALKWAVCARALGWLEETQGKRQGGRLAEGPRLSGYFEALYGAAILSRKRARGVLSSKVVVDG